MGLPSLHEREGMVHSCPPKEGRYSNSLPQPEVRNYYTCPTSEDRNDILFNINTRCPTAPIILVLA